MSHQIDENVILFNHKFVKQREYWAGKLAGMEGTTGIPAFNPLLTTVTDPIEMTFPAQLCERLRAFSKNSDLSLYIVLLTGVKILIYRYAGQVGVGDADEVGVFSPIYVPNAGFDTLNNCLLIRDEVPGELSFIQLLLKVRQTVLGAYENQDYPFTGLMEYIFKDNSDRLSSTICCSLRNIHDSENINKLAGQLSFIFENVETGIKGSLIFGPGLYGRDFAQQLANHYLNILERVMADIHIKIRDIPFLTEAEKKRLLVEFNGEMTDSLPGKTVDRFIEGHALNKPDTIAIKYEDDFITYTELNRRAEILAGVLINKGIDKDKIAGILMTRSPYMVQSILAVWKAGGAYMPIDPGYPQERIDYMLKDSGAAFLLTDFEKKKMANCQLSIVNGEWLMGEPAASSRTSNLADIAYIIYTSGSTGKPKAAVVEHLGMMNHIRVKIHDLGLNGGSIIVQNATHTFDISVWQFFAALTCGGKTVIYPDALIFEPGEWVSQLKKDRVSILEVVPSYLAVMLENIYTPEGKPIPLELTYLLVTGEEIKPALVKKWFEAYPGIKMVNAYGPTEAADDITHYIMDRLPELERIPIGKPLQNFTILIVDQDMQLCPVGVMGELVVRGIGVGRGYLNKPELTKAKFTGGTFEKAPAVTLNNHQSPITNYPSPLTPHPSPLYKTGDLARWLPDGNIEFFGRIDYQVKVRGFRIELAEIEKVLAAYPPVQDVIVTVKEWAGDKSICAYIVAGERLDFSLVREYLLEWLPDYMVPQYFTQLDGLPLLPSGKVDRKNLPDPDTGSYETVSYITWEILENLRISTGAFIIRNKPNRKKDSPGDLETAETVLISEAERRVILDEFNKTEVPYELHWTFHGLVERQIARTPANIAVIYKDRHLTYGRLDQIANRLALYLRDKGVGQGTILAIAADRCLEMIPGLLAALKAGAAYLPVDPGYPGDRIQYILEDTRPALMLALAPLPEGITAGMEIIHIGAYAFETGTEILKNVNRSTDPAYIMYTSGSTGKPKGALISHRQLLNAVFGLQDGFRLGEIDIKLLQLASFCFDVFTGDLAKAFLHGGRLILTPEDVSGPRALYEQLKIHKITVMESTPSSVVPLLDYIYEENLVLEHLQLLIIGADILPLEDYRRIQSRFAKSIRILNSYGVTEAAIDNSYYEAAVETLPTEGNLAIGKPMPNMKFYVLDKEGRLLPVGAIGELYIGGESVASGYVNRVTLTTERFLPDPFCPGANGAPGWMYRTGDVVRWLPDGNIEFLGRSDYQVKIGGIRVEPGEIENFLLKHNDIKEAIIVGREDPPGNKYLCAYLVSDQDLKISELRAYLSGKLPLYMVPAYFFRLEKVPITPNGKVDRNLLAAIDPKTIISHEYIGPRDELERKLVEIWMEILGARRELISIDANFFELGGNSIKATVMTTKIHQKINVKVPLVEVFNNFTIRGLSKYIKESQEHKYKEIQPVEKQEYYKLSSAQKRLYFMQQMNPESTAYNIVNALVMENEPTGEDVAYLQNAFKRLLARHESLRTSFTLIAGEPVQRIDDHVAFEIESADTGDTLDTFIRSFDLSRAPLLRVGLIKTAEGKKILAIDIHHIIADGISYQVLEKDFAAYCAGKTPPSLKIHYKDYSVWQNSERFGREMKRQEEYWLHEFPGETPLLNLPLDYPRPEIQDFAGDRVRFYITKEKTDVLHRIAAAEEATLFMILLAIGNILLAQVSAQEDIVIGTSISGRNHPDLQEVIGMFINMLALRNNPAPGKKFKSFLGELRHNVMQAFANQDYPYDELVKKLGLQGRFQQNPLFNVVLTMVSPGENSLASNDEAADSQTDKLKISPYGYMRKLSQFDLIFGVIETGNGLAINLEYATSLFKRSTAEKLAEYFQDIVAQVIANPGGTIAEIMPAHAFLVAGDSGYVNEQNEFEF